MHTHNTNTHTHTTPTLTHYTHTRTHNSPAIKAHSLEGEVIRDNSPAIKAHSIHNTHTYTTPTYTHNTHSRFILEGRVPKNSQTGTFGGQAVFKYPRNSQT